MMLHPLAQNAVTRSFGPDGRHVGIGRVL